MRTIKFRGKRIDGKGLAYGDLLTGCGYKKGRYFILPHLDFYPSDCSSLDGYEIITDTVGQFTGLTDKNGKEIYEGDILQEIGSGKTVLVVYEAPQFCYADNSFGYKFLNLPENYTVIGNIHDNPELLKGGAK